MTNASHHAIRDFVHKGARYLDGEPFPASEVADNVRGLEMARLIEVGPPPAKKAARAAERRDAMAAAAAVTPTPSVDVDLTDDELEAATAPEPKRAAGKRR